MATGILIALGVAVAAVLIFARLRRRPPQTVEAVAPANPFPSSRGGAILRRFISAIYDPALGNSQLDAMRNEFRGAANEVLPALTETWRATPDHETGLRWTLVYVAPMAGPSAVAFLRDVLFSAVSPERSEDPHSYSTKAWDSIIRAR